MLVSAIVSARVLVFFTRSRVVILFAIGGGVVVFFARAGFAAGATATIVTITRRFGFAAQGFEFIPGLDVIAIKSFSETLFLGFDEDHDLVAHRQHINDLAFALGRDDTLIAFGQRFARFNILLIFVDEATAQTSAHAGDLVGGERDALVFCHLDGDGGEVGQEFGTAAGFDAARAHAADDLCHVTRTDLPHLDVCVGVDVLHVPFEDLRSTLSSLSVLNRKASREPS